MKKNVTISILVFVTLIMLLFAFLQKTEANKQRIMAEINLQLAEEAQKQAEMNAQEATRQRETAIKEAENARTAQAELALCRLRK